MALHKEIKMPGCRHASSYVRIDMIERVDFRQRTGKVNLRLYDDEETAKHPEIPGFSHDFGHLVLSQVAFDKYMSKAAVKAALKDGKDAYELLYDILALVLEAQASRADDHHAKRADADAPATHTDDQRNLLLYAEYRGPMSELDKPLAGHVRR